MEDKIYKYISASLVLINFWTLYGFFDYYLDPPGVFRGLGLGIFYFNSLFAGVSIGFILIIIRMILYFAKRKNFLKSNFLYILTGVFNINLSLISLICLCLEIFILDLDFILFVGSLILISIIFAFDIYNTNFKRKK